MIGANNITLDLNGHKIDGDRHEPGPDPAYGVFNAGHDGVTIQNGMIRDFYDGALIHDASKNRIRNLTVSHQIHGGVGVNGSSDVQVENNVASGNQVGIYVEDSRNVRVVQNTSSNNRSTGVGLFGAQNVAIAENSISGNVDSGIGVFNDSANNQIERNSVSGNAEGINIALGSHHNLVNENTASGNVFDGVLFVGTHHNVVTSNSLRNNGITGISVFSGDDNVIAQNSVAGNGDGSEAGLEISADPETPGDASERNVVSKNTVTGSRGDGILVSADQLRTVIDGNRVRESTDDGIDVESAATTLRNNTANRNHDLGIEAAPGVTDGGGNTAGGNGNPLQCINVACTPA